MPNGASRRSRLFACRFDHFQEVDRRHGRLEIEHVAKRRIAVGFELGEPEIIVKLADQGVLLGWDKLAQERLVAERFRPWR